MIVPQQQVEKLRKALAESTEANRSSGRNRDEELSRRCTVRVWRLGDKALEIDLQQLLEMLHGETLCQFNISVWGASDEAGVRVNIRTDKNRKTDIDDFARPEDFGGDVPIAILQALTDMADDFRREPKPG